MQKKLIGTLVLVLGVFCQLSYGQAVFQSFDLIVSNPAGVVAAISKAQASVDAQDNLGRVYLHQYMANGESQATHNVLVVYDSPEDMSETIKANLTSADWATFKIGRAHV